MSKPLLTTETAFLEDVARNYQVFRNIVAEVVTGSPFKVLTDDHVGDIAATIANLDSALPATIARLVAAGDDASAFESVGMACHLLAKSDPAIYDTAGRVGIAEEIYKLRCECDGQLLTARESNNRREDSRWWEARNGDVLWRRRELYRLRHLKAAKAAAKKKKAEAA